MLNERISLLLSCALGIVFLLCELLAFRFALVIFMVAAVNPLIRLKIPLNPTLRTVFLVE